jgi:hypothetical protein
MAGRKRKSDYLEQIMNVKKAKTEADKAEAAKIEEETKEDATADEHLARILKNSSSSDIMYEYLTLKKRMPKLLNNEESNLLHEVKKELKINEIEKENWVKVEQNYKGENNHPILDALSFKLGMSLKHILAPPTTKCLLCKKFLIPKHKPVQVALHTTSGPEMATRYIWECKRCVGAHQMKESKISSVANQDSDDIHYHPDQYGNTNYGYKKYSSQFKVNVFRSSNEVYCSKMLLKQYISELQHCFTSAEGKAESYNETFRDTDKVLYFTKFQKFNPLVGGHFFRRMAKDEDNFVDDHEDFPADKVVSKMHELGRKSLSQAYFNYQVYNEMVDRNEVDKRTFGPKISQTNSKERISYRKSMDDYMKEIDEIRKEELYPHTDSECSVDCKKRGCGKVVSVDGLWKLTYKICMWEPTFDYPEQDISDYIPNVCTEYPASGSAFCDHHAKIVENQGYPSDLRKFLEKCGATPSAYSKEGKSKVTKVLQSLSKHDPQTSTVGDAQGVTHFLRNKKIANKENFKSSDSECRKDIGENTRLHRRSRGVECIVSGGGIVNYWSPLYKSEGPTQVALIMLKFLLLFFQAKANITREDFENFFMSYDNICHVDELKLLANRLALPAPYDEVWLSIQKVIDPLHIRNHKRPKCKQLYNPEKVKEAIPEANLMCAEQTFAWMGRYKKIFNSMTKTHFHFMLHRLVKERNSYTTHCYKANKKPLLPSAKIVKKD